MYILITFHYQKVKMRLAAFSDRLRWGSHSRYMEGRRPEGKEKGRITGDEVKKGRKRECRRLIYTRYILKMRKENKNI